MITGISQAIKDILIYGTRDQRLYVCEQEFAYFCFYYYSEYFEDYESAPFHYDFFEDCRLLAESIEIDEALWIAFRESAKTTIAKMFVVWLICFRKKKYIAWDSYDGKNAENAFYDISVMLQTNKKILADFGRLYRKRRHQKTAEELLDDAPEMKRLTNFVTTNKIRCEAFTTQVPARGRVLGRNRPDMFIFDDIENNVTKNSPALTIKIMGHVDEVRSGLGASGAVLYLGNLITEEGSIAHIMDNLKAKHKKIVRNIPVVSRTGVIAWPDKYVKTNEEAARINATLPTTQWKISLEQKKMDLNGKNSKVYETEMLNDPEKSGDYFFDRARIRQLLDKCDEPIKVNGNMKIWANFDPTHRYAGGGDTAQGNGGDSNASCFIDFTRLPNLLVASYEDNSITASIFGHEFVRQGNLYGECFLIPEINNTGYATVAAMVDLRYTNMYIREVKNKTSNQVQKEYGWFATVGTKYEVLSQFKAAVEGGELEVLDKDLLEEMYHMTKTHARLLVPPKGMTAHFDKVRAAALAWHGRTFATLSKVDKDTMYKAPKRGPYEA